MFDEDLSRFEEEIDQRVRELQAERSKILKLDIQHIQEFVWAFTRAYENGDMLRCGRIFDILVTLSHTKDELPTLQEYFGGTKIGRYKSTIHIDKASEWVTYLGEIIIGKTDYRVKPEPVS